MDPTKIPILSPTIVPLVSATPPNSSHPWKSDKGLQGNDLPNFEASAFSSSLSRPLPESPWPANLQPLTLNSTIAVKELRLRYYNKESLQFTLYP